jgi:hypothetical protein
MGNGIRRIVKKLNPFDPGFSWGDKIDEVNPSVSLKLLVPRSWSLNQKNKNKNKQI